MIMQINGIFQQSLLVGNVSQNIPGNRIVEEPVRFVSAFVEVLHRMTVMHRSWQAIRDRMPTKHQETLTLLLPSGDGSEQ